MSASGQAERAARFLALHVPGEPLLLPNPWDAGSAKVLESLGFQALATTSGGFAATLGCRDGRVTRDEAITHSADLVAATPLPVSADLEDAFAGNDGGVPRTVERAREAGLAGCSIEDWSGEAILPLDEAAERVAAAAEAAHGGEVRLVLTGRAENFIRGNKDLADTIARLQAYQEAGADVLYAPGPVGIEEIRTIVAEVDRPVNVLARNGAPPVAELAEAGVARVSVGGGFAYAAIGGAVEAAREFMEHGTYGFWERAGVGAKAALEAFDA